MADRPWVTPEEVRQYSEIKEVQERSDDRLKADIARAERRIIKYTHNDFNSYDEAPYDLKLAVILLTERISRSASAANIKKRGLASESFDDYSYTLNNSESEIDISGLGLEDLLEEFIIDETKNGKVTFRLRRL